MRSAVIRRRTAGLRAPVRWRIRPGLGVLALVGLMVAGCSGGGGTTSPDTGLPAGKPGAASGRAGPVTGTPPGQPGRAVHLFPDTAMKCTILTVRGAPEILAGATIHWRINGVEDPENRNRTYPCTHLRKGDQVGVRLVKAGKTYDSQDVRIANSPPVIERSVFTETYLKAGSEVGIRVTASDPDGDPIRLSYEWTVNDEEAGYADVLERRLKRGDRVRVVVGVQDGTASGTPAVSESVVQNAPPSGKTGPGEVIDGVYRLQVRGADADGDAVRFAILEAPEGMAIDETGLITWTPPGNATGRFPVRVALRDGHGGESVLVFDVTISEPARRSAAVP